MEGLAVPELSEEVFNFGRYWVSYPAGDLKCLSGVADGLTPLALLICKEGEVEERPCNIWLFAKSSCNRQTLLKSLSASSKRPRCAATTPRLPSVLATSGSFPSFLSIARLSRKSLAASSKRPRLSATKPRLFSDPATPGSSPILLLIARLSWWSLSASS